MKRLSVVLAFAVGGLADGEAFAADATVEGDKDWRRENLRAVGFAQESGSRRILAAGALRLFE